MSELAIFATVLLSSIGCGIGCISLSVPILVGKMMGEGRDAKGCLRAIIIFSMAKTMIYIFLGLTVSVMGNVLTNSLYTILPNLVVLCFRILCIGFGVVIIARVIKTKNTKKTACKHCLDCDSNKFVSSKMNNDGSYFVMGILYALIPCGSWITAVGFCSMLTPLKAFLLMISFGIVDSILSIVLCAPFVGVVIKGIKKGMPQVFSYVRVTAGFIMIAMGILVNF